ncbi:MAG: hypothetical protein FWD79_02295 [Desulfobulbus sp.]|nr:hypothetical protein [Desulfobulbus sp.]
MKKNMMRTPLLKAGLVLLVLVLLASLTSASPDGSVLNSIGQIIIGAFRLVQWAIAMAISLTVCIAVLIAIFLFAVLLVNREAAASMYRTVKETVRTVCGPICSRFGAASGRCREEDASCPAPPLQTAVAAAPDPHFQEELHAMAVDAVRKVSESQQALSDQFSALAGKMQVLEEKSADFAAANQLDAITSELAASGKTLATIQEQVAALEGKIDGTVQQLQGITPESMLGDIPARLQQLERPKDEQPPFDPAPLAASIENLQVEVEELKKRKNANGPTKAKKKA